MQDYQGLEEGHYRRLELGCSRYIKSAWTDCLLTYARFRVIHSAVRTKIKSPADSPSLCSLNDKIRTKDFPKDHNHLLTIADPLNSTAPWDQDTMFDDATLNTTCLDMSCVKIMTGRQTPHLVRYHRSQTAFPERHRSLLASHRSLLRVKTKCRTSRARQGVSRGRQHIHIYV